MLNAHLQIDNCLIEYNHGKVTFTDTNTDTSTRHPVSFELFTDILILSLGGSVTDEHYKRVLLFFAHHITAFLNPNATFNLRHTLTAPQDTTP